MSREDVPVSRREQVHAAMEAINARDFEALNRVPFDPEGEFCSAVASVEGVTYSGGAEGLRDWAMDIDTIFDDFYAEVVEVHEVGDDQAVVLFRVVGRAKASGFPLDARVAQVWTWRHGKIWRNVAYTDPREAFEAVGLRE